MDKETAERKMRYMIANLRQWDNAYEKGHPIVSDKMYDDIYFKLVALEREYGALPYSPTQNIYYGIVNNLEKVTHNHLMLSLDKTKEINDIVSFAGGRDIIAMPKLDGLTCSLTYENGKLIAAETRGNGEIGENIYHNALVIPSIPKRIPFRKQVVIDGEIICKYADFEAFNSDYKNPRNFAAGSIRLLDNKECEKRHLTFIPWDVVKYEGFDFDLLSDKLHWLMRMGFPQVCPLIRIPYLESYTNYMRSRDLVKYKDTDAVKEIIDKVKELAEDADFPIDGVVFKYDNVRYYNSLGNTGHHFRGGIAFKFYDDLYDTKLKYINWTMGRTGVLTPVAVFDPVEIEGSVVERASLHNVSIMREVLGDCAYVGEPLKVYKANMIIPQIAEAGPKYNYGEVIAAGGVSANDMLEHCPICGGKIIYTNNDGVENAYCSNPECPGKLINKLDHYCGKKGMDIKGLSKQTLEKLIDWEWVNKISDIYTLQSHRVEWVNKDGFGDKSVTKILEAISDSKGVSLDKFITAMGIPFIGESVSKELVKYVNSYEDFRQKVKEKYNFSKIPTFGPSKNDAILKFNYEDFDYIYDNYLHIIEKPKVEMKDSLKDITIVITGKLKCYKNRAALEEDIRAHGGKISSSVSAKTNYLINNDTTSTSSKNLTAQKLGVEIISEEDFINKFLT